LIVAVFLLDHVGGQVGAELLVDDGRVRVQGLLDVHHRVQRLQVHHDVGQRVLGHVAALGHDHGDGLTHVLDLVLGQWHVCGGVELEALDGGRRRYQ
jgi:hypothetical protein